MTAVPFPEVVGTLAREFGSVPREVIERCVASLADQYRDARVTAFVAHFVERAARRQVTAPGGGPSSLVGEPKAVTGSPPGGERRRRRRFPRKRPGVVRPSDAGARPGPPPHPAAGSPRSRGGTRRRQTPTGSLVHRHVPRGSRKGIAHRDDSLDLFLRPAVLVGGGPGPSRIGGPDHPPVEGGLSGTLKA